MKFEKSSVWGFEHAIRGMRNPLNSWHLSDSSVNTSMVVKTIENGVTTENFTIGPNDLNLAKRLIHGGAEHRKFLRQIFVSVDITAPLYWWKEFDTYKVGTVANSTSTMHKITSKPITLDCFEIDDFEPDVTYTVATENSGIGITDIIQFCESLRQKYLETKDKKIWKELIRWLPEGWLQTRTVTLTYENLRIMYHQRKGHKLNEWSGLDDKSKPNFIGWVKMLPYSKELIVN